MTTPFKAVKEWELFNIQNSSSILLESFSASVPITDTFVALDYVDYTSTSPIINRDCDMALEQQEEDLVMFEDGISGSGIFYPDLESKNYSGTYKRLLYTQISRAFYNQYRNPIEIFGMENIDFPLSKTNRYLAEKFRMISVPQHIFGDKMVEGSIKFYDTTFDDNVDIYDDKAGNLMAGTNLFSKVQEVRKLGNNLQNGWAEIGCPSYENIIIQNGILWMLADDGNYYEVRCINDGGITTLSIDQVPSTPPFAGMPYVVFRADDSYLYKWSLFIDMGIVNYKIEPLPSLELYLSSINLISDDMTYHTVSLIIDDGVVTLSIIQ